MVNLMNYNPLIYIVVTCTAFLLSYFLYNLIKNNYFSNIIEVTTNNSSNIKVETISDSKNVIYRNIKILSLSPLSQWSGDMSTYTIHELKFEEITLFYSRELTAFRVTEAEVWDTISSFEAAALYANDINEIIITILSYIHM
jgi:hypothetical protein